MFTILSELRRTLTDDLLHLKTWKKKMSKTAIAPLAPELSLMIWKWRRTRRNGKWASEDPLTPG